MQYDQRHSITKARYNIVLYLHTISPHPNIICTRISWASGPEGLRATNALRPECSTTRGTTSHQHGAIAVAGPPKPTSLASPKSNLPLYITPETHSPGLLKITPIAPPPADLPTHLQQLSRWRSMACCGVMLHLIPLSHARSACR